MVCIQIPFVLCIICIVTIYYLPIYDKYNTFKLIYQCNFQITQDITTAIFFIFTRIKPRHEAVYVKHELTCCLFRKHVCFHKNHTERIYHLLLLLNQVVDVDFFPRQGSSNQMFLFYKHQLHSQFNTWLITITSCASISPICLPVGTGLSLPVRITTFYLLICFVTF